FYSRSLSRAIFSCDHKSVGLRFLCLALFSVLAGMSLSLVMRLQYGQTGPFGSASAEKYAVTTLLHGSLMVFFVLTAAPHCGFGYFFLPLQIGARELAFPLFSGLSFWMAAISLVGFTFSALIPVAAGSALWLLSAMCFCAAMLLASLNLA